MCSYMAINTPVLYPFCMYICTRIHISKKVYDILPYYYLMSRVWYHKSFLQPLCMYCNEVVDSWRYKYTWNNTLTIHLSTGFKWIRLSCIVIYWGLEHSIRSPSATDVSPHHMLICPHGVSSHTHIHQLRRMPYVMFQCKSKYNSIETLCW